MQYLRNRYRRYQPDSNYGQEAGFPLSKRTLTYGATINGQPATISF